MSEDKVAVTEQAPWVKALMDITETLRKTQEQLQKTLEKSARQHKELRRLNRVITGRWSNCAESEDYHEAQWVRQAMIQKFGFEVALQVEIEFLQKRQGALKETHESP